MTNDKVESFKYLGTNFDNDFKWRSNTDYVYGKVKKIFYAYFRFKHFRPASACLWYPYLLSL